MLYLSNLTNIPSSQPGRPGSDLSSLTPPSAIQDMAACEESVPSPGPSHLLSYVRWVDIPAYISSPFIPPANIWLLPTLRPKGTHTDGMICPPEDGSREETAQALELISGLFGQEILGYSYPENGLGRMHGLLPWSYWLFIQRREAQPEEGLKRASRVLGHGRSPSAQVQG